MAINSLSASSHGLSGLASGMDTQQMVEAMLAGTQTKIDVASQKKSTLTYKQSMYRDVSAKLKAFQLSYFKYSGSSGTNLMSPTFFNAMSAVSNSRAFKATAGTSAATGKTTVNYVRQLASTLKHKSKETATGKLEGTFDSASMEKVNAPKNKLTSNSLKIQAGTDEAISISLDKLAGKSGFALEEALNNELKDSGITVEYKSGQFTFKQADKKDLFIRGNETALALVGLGRETEVYGKEGTLTTSLNGNNLLSSINVEFNGVTKNVTINPFEVTDTESIARLLNAGIQSAFGANVSVVGDNNTGKLLFKTKDDSSVLTLKRPTNQDNGLDLLGMSSGSSTKISTGSALKDLNLKTKVIGETQRFSIGGVDFNFSSDTSLLNVISSINNSDAGVKISYSDIEDKFIIESALSGELGIAAGDTNPFKMSQEEGNLLTALFGVKSGGAATSKELTYNKSVVGGEFDPGHIFEMKDKPVKVSVGGISVELKLTKNADGKYTMADLVSELNERAAASLKGAELTFSVETVGDKEQLKVTTATGANIKLGDGFDTFGMTKDTVIGKTVATGSNTLAEVGMGNNVSLKIGGETVNATGATTLEKLREDLETAAKKAVTDAGGDGSQVTVSLDEKGRFRIFGVEIPMTLEITGDDGKLFGTSKVEFSQGPATAGTVEMQKGQNAIISVNGVEIERNSNQFSVNGISYDLKETNFKQATDADGKLLYLDKDGNTTLSPTRIEDGVTVANKMKGVDNAEEIDVSRDTTKVLEGIKKFVEDYNKLINEINGLLDADAKEGCRSYPPLTTKQKEAMSEKEIELWEEKSKQGLLRGDSVLENVISNLRSTIYSKVDGGKLAMYDIGLSTSSPISASKDNLVLDESQLTKMLSQEPDEVIKLFTNAQQGFAQSMNKAIDKAIGTTPGKYGSIVLQAGAVGYNITDSFLYKELKSVDERITSLERTYQSEYNRYWSQFNKMEQTISQMNQQSAWLAQQFG